MCGILLRGMYKTWPIFEAGPGGGGGGVSVLILTTYVVRGGGGEVWLLHGIAHHKRSHKIKPHSAVVSVTGCCV